MSDRDLERAMELTFEALYIADTRLCCVERAALLHHILKRLSGERLSPERRQAVSVSSPPGQRH